MKHNGSKVRDAGYVPGSRKAETWIEGMPRCMNVRIARAGIVDKGRMRTAVLGGWYVWQAEELAHEDSVGMVARAGASRNELCIRLMRYKWGRGVREVQAV